MTLNPVEWSKLAMSKTGWIILIVCLGLVFCICAGLFLAGRIANSHLFNGGDTRVDSSATKNYKDLKNDYSADGSYSVTMKDLKELHIDWISGSVTVELTDGDSIRFQELADTTIKEKDALRYGTSGSTLRIQACKKGHVGSLPRKDLVVYLPRALADKLKECEIDTVSASISAGDLDLEELEIDTVSGRVKLNDMRVEEAQVDTVSGSVSWTDCAIDTLRTDSVSGQVKVTGVAKKVKASSVSGEISLALTDSKELKISTMSGPIILDLATAPKSLDIDTTSGKTRLTLPKDVSCTISLDAMSGKLYLNDEAIASKELTLGDGSAAYDVDSMSGSVYVFTK